MSARNDTLVKPSHSFHTSSAQLSVSILGLVSLGFSFYATSIGFNNTLFDFHGFRQAQTAISADAIFHGGSFWHYETPVLGPPWSLPFEFPLYQGIVAWSARLLSTSLDQTGRFVSIFFYYSCFFPLASILYRSGMRGTAMIPPLALFAVSPLYVFISRLFMIESTAMFFSLLYTDQMFRLVLSKARWQHRHIFLGALFGGLAGLIKVTTFAPFFVLGTSLALWGLWKDREAGILKKESALAAGIFCVAFPMLATWRWTQFADGIKAQNPLGIFLTSHALRAWNFGPFAERLHPRIYLQLWNAASNHVGNVWVAVVVLFTYTVLYRKWNLVATACVALYAGTILLFFNLHVVHEYYPYSNAIFLVVATGVLISEVLKVQGARAWIGVGLLVLVMGACVLRYFSHYYPIQKNNAAGRPDVAALIDKVTDSRDVILITGLDWSAELPYQSHRRAIMDATFDPKVHTWNSGPIEQAIANLNPQKVAALVACDKGRYGDRLPILLNDLSFIPRTDLHADQCDVYARGFDHGPTP